MVPEMSERWIECDEQNFGVRPKDRATRSSGVTFDAQKIRLDGNPFHTTVRHCCRVVKMWC